MCAKTNITKTTNAGEIQKNRVLLLAIFILAVSFLFRDAVITIVQSWQREEYSHGYIIPIVALVLLLNKMADISIAPRNSWLGFAMVSLLIILQLCFEIAGIKGALPQIYMLSIIGVFILFMGAGSAYPLAGPLLFLLFSAPLPKSLYYDLSLDMQILSTSLGAKILEALEVPVFQEGNIIDLGGYKLQVAEACNGLRYLFPLLSLSFLLAYMYQTSLLKRTLLFLSALPITIIMNGLRITLIGISVVRWGPQMAAGFIHDFEGWVVFLGCILCLLAEIKVFQLVGSKGVLNFDCLRLPKSFSFKAPDIGIPVYAGSAILLFAILISFFIPDLLAPVPLRQPFASFPLQLGSWTGHFESLDSDTLSRLGADDYLLADYLKHDSPPVNLYTLYYPKQDSSSNQAIHTPAGCIPGSGWTINENATRLITLNDKAITVNRLIISKDKVRQVVYYWYETDGHITLNPYITRLLTIKAAFTQRHTNGAMIRVMTMMSSGEPERDADRRLVDFLQNSLDTLDGFMFPHSSDGPVVK